MLNIVLFGSDTADWKIINKANPLELESGEFNRRTADV